MRDGRPRHQGESIDIKADIVARQQPAVAIEGRVLDRLGGDRRAELLEARDGAGATGSANRRSSGSIAQRSVARQVRRAPAAARSSTARSRPTGCRCPRRCDRPGSAPAARPAGDARSAVTTRHRQRRRRRHRAGHRNCGPGSRAGLAAPRRRNRPAGRSAPTRPRPARSARRVVLQGAHLIHEVVAGGAVTAPVRGQALAAPAKSFRPPARRRVSAAAAGSGNRRRDRSRPSTWSMRRPSTMPSWGADPMAGHGRPRRLRAPPCAGTPAR